MTADDGAPRGYAQPLRADRASDHRHESVRGHTVCVCPVERCEWHGSFGAMQAHIHQWHELRDSTTVDVHLSPPERPPARPCVRLNRVCKTHHQLWPCRSEEVTHG